MSNPGGYVPGPADLQPYRLQPGERIISSVELMLRGVTITREQAARILRAAEITAATAPPEEPESGS